MSDWKEQLTRVLDGVASEEDIAGLVDVLRDDEDARVEAGNYLELHGQLAVALEDELVRERRVKGIMDSLSEEDREGFVRGVKRRISRPQRVMGRLAVAAVLMLPLAGVWFVVSGRGDADLMATVTRIENIEWGELDQEDEGNELAAGSLLRFKSGLIELDLDGRGRLIVEGPAHLEFPEAGRAILKRGRIVMRATKAGHGYRVETPQGSIVDLGTEFGVSVGSDGLVETHVLEGHVEAIGDDGESVTLREDDALQLGPGGGQRIEVDASQFYTQMPPEHSGGNSYVHWSFDDGEGLLSRANRHRIGGADADFVFYAMDEGRAPMWIEGVFGSGLKLDGRGGYAESNFRGIGGGKPRTVCFWVKVPEDSSQNEGYGMLSWGQYRHEGPGEVWQIATNPNEWDGPLGCLRVGIYGGQAVGTTDLRDGEWHHVAVVLYGGSQPDVGTHVMFYLDGESEPVSRRALRAVRTEVDVVNHGVWLGRNVTYVKSNPDHIHGGFFRGEMDEVYIFDGVLDREEIVRIMEKNEVPR